LGGVQVVVQASSISLHAILPDGRPSRADYLSNIGLGPVPVGRLGPKGAEQWDYRQFLRCREKNAISAWLKFW